LRKLGARGIGRARGGAGEKQKGVKKVKRLRGRPDGDITLRLESANKRITLWKNSK